MTPKISVIVPVYKAEKYLHRCVDSILAQTFQDFEVLLIDDGSPDKSGEICDEYAKRDSRVRVFHKENGGVASARQIGTDKALGEYSIHIDADDWIESTMLEEMYDTAINENTDMVICDFFIDNKNSCFYKTQRTELVSNKVIKNILRGKIMGALWNKLIRHDLYKKYNIRYINNINYCEDVLVLSQLLIHKDLNVAYLNRAFYHYNICNNSSITQNYTIKSYTYRKDFILTLDNILPDEYKEDIIIAALNVKFEAFRNNILSQKDYFDFKPHTIKTILSSTLPFKGKLFFLCCNIGLFNYCSLLYKHLKECKGNLF